jgi:hypothetical protein
MNQSSGTHPQSLKYDFLPSFSFRTINLAYSQRLSKISLEFKKTDSRCGFS